MKIFYFSATGNSLEVAKKIGGELYSIPKVLRGNRLNFRDEKIGLVFPCHYLGVPSIVREFLRKVDLESNYIFAVMTYGQFAGDGLNHLIQIADKSSLKIAYAKAILMTTNYLPMFDVKKEIEKEEDKKMEENLEHIIADINMKRVVSLSSNLQGKMMTIMGSILYKINRWKAHRKFYIRETCTKCELCAKVCPVDNIEVNSKPRYENNCQMCLACINLCPQQAIKLKKEKGDARFMNNNVSIDEIVAANHDTFNLEKDDSI